MKKPIIAILMLALGMLVLSACGSSGTENVETAAAEETTAPEAREDDAGKAPADETAEKVDRQKKSFAAPTPLDFMHSLDCGPTDNSVGAIIWICTTNCEQCGCTLKRFKNEDGEYVERWIGREFVSAVIGWRELPYCPRSYCPKGLTGPDAPVIKCLEEMPHDMGRV